MLALTACGLTDQSKIEKAIRDNLKDPDSAQFRNLIIDKHGNRACIEFNAKNGFGGYGDWETVSLEKNSSMSNSWFPTNIDLNGKLDKVETEKFCSSLGVDVDVNAIHDKAFSDAQNTAIETIKKNKHISSEEVQKTCGSAVYIFATYQSGLAVARALNNKEDIDKFEKMLLNEKPLEDSVYCPS